MGELPEVNISKYSIVSWNIGENETVKCMKRAGFSYLARPVPEFLKIDGNQSTVPSLVSLRKYAYGLSEQLRRIPEVDPNEAVVQQLSNSDRTAYLASLGEHGESSNDGHSQEARPVGCRAAALETDKGRDLALYAVKSGDTESKLRRSNIFLQASKSWTRCMVAKGHLDPGGIGRGAAIADALIRKQFIQDNLRQPVDDTQYRLLMAIESKIADDDAKCLEPHAAQISAFEDKLRSEAFSKNSDLVTRVSQLLE